MKKIVVMAVAAVAAVAANAAAFAWSATGIQKVDGNSSVGSSAYLVDASVVSRDAMITALTAGDTSLLTGSAILLETATIAQGSSGVSRVNLTGGTATASSYSAYTIVIDSAKKNFLASSQISDVSTPDLGDVAFSFGSQSGVAWTAMVPEPTSGLLMLVGLAGLALRRRRA